MASRIQRPAMAGDWLKLCFFAVLGLIFVAVLWVDDRFWFDPADPHSQRIFAVRSLLMFHGLAGLTALTTGTLQMSSRIRSRNPALHRALGKLYLFAVCLSAPVAIYIGVSTLEPSAIRVEQAFQGGLWLGCALLAWVCARIRQMPMHRDWMIRSYGLTLVFVTSRVPDIIFTQYSNQFLSDLLWALILCAMIAPEVIGTISVVARAAARKRPA